MQKQFTRQCLHGIKQIYHLTPTNTVGHLETTAETENVSNGSYQLDVKLPHHLHLQVDDVFVTGVPEEKKKKKKHQHSWYKPLKEGVQRSETDLKSSRVSWIMFWMKCICREVRGAAPACPTTSAMLLDSEEETADDRAGPEGAERTLRIQKTPLTVKR